MKRHSIRRSAGMSLADLLVVVALIPLILVAFLGCRHERGEGSGRVKCASNLRQIGQSVLLYANDNRNSFPRTVYQPADNVIPVFGTGAAAMNPFAADGPAPNDITAAMFLLLRTLDLEAEVFVCPNTNAERWDFDGKSAASFSNWQGIDGIRQHLSYSFQNCYPDNAAVKSGFKWDNTISQNFPIAADMNPGVGANSNVLAVKFTSTGQEMRQGNSRNHDRDGQNVLYADYHVDFLNSPFGGIESDNIYARRAQGSKEASSAVVNSPLDANDCVLLPAEN